jgi:hypothetical protein
MTSAIIGLIGVAVGAIISGSTAFVLARRTERSQMRASARLLEVELRGVAEQTKAIIEITRLSPVAHHNEYPTQSILSQLHDIPQSTLWDQHKATLAAVLSTQDWYAVATAYQSIDALRGAAHSNFFLPDGTVLHALIGQVIMQLMHDAESGAEAVARLAGGSPPTTVTVSSILVESMRKASKERSSDSDHRGPRSAA